jgi:hypothetical protein
MIPSRKEAKECSPRRKPWEREKQASPYGAQDKD